MAPGDKDPFGVEAFELLGGRANGEAAVQRLCAAQLCLGAAAAGCPAEDLTRALDVRGGRRRPVEPTNNAAERSLRGPVIHRKLSHGTRTQEGERFVERALSASVTCRLQGRSLFAYLLTAHPRGDPLPNLARSERQSTGN